jgi:hypothetical protein
MNPGACSAGTGWCPDGIKESFVVSEPEFGPSSVVIMNVVNEQGASLPSKCEVVSQSITPPGFVIACDCRRGRCPSNKDSLRYVLVKP